MRTIKRVKLILPALTEATSPYWRPIKYSLFPPLGLATLAAFLGDNDEVTIEDEHVERLHLVRRRRRFDELPDFGAIEIETGATDERAVRHCETRCKKKGDCQCERMAHHEATSFRCE